MKGLFKTRLVVFITFALVLFPLVAYSERFLVELGIIAVGAFNAFVAYRIMRGKTDKELEQLFMLPRGILDE